MRLITNVFLTTSLAVFTALVAGPVRAADVDASSAVDAVTVYPDGASVTRIISVDLPAGDNTAVLKDFPLTLDPSRCGSRARRAPSSPSARSTQNRRARRRRSICLNSTSASRR